ncbi:archaetidylserine decarboxylase [Acinetobacter gerneri]|uniref:Phosphatidylserine decarboxylase proenzyme n=2 Tax=Acinetobacter gerneri TaxID=202952 RepID=N8ZDR0_9GAMM|nr:archaetidylserine decarboxylase [Acinetobacter gerneri]ENV31854.1 phosphatidylserine decarboxylase proenzyme [Acinetobacter gerneri DSM 14967 = CIP 107464 = MTCC 9824]EPR82564.1 Phosphatidylserine decarboxylase [Acinetobacter gerneri DSM 14967 = CIP 107464 = MTCC 9824]MCH4243602.1 archaetidylserine decarboxylase [Acinetobacter gerneri]MDQ9011462.1 archaetidylserine decarboxylase [Acinetobacter gerneri]MDQ9015597.1 archaetidylserine decarboxylase [Acinetobacter gerneri]
MSFISQLKKQAFIQAQRIVPQQQLSRVVGKIAASENPVVKNVAIQAFKAQYGIDLSIAEQTNALKYKSFNEFFTRALKEGIRDIDQDPLSVVCPADGAISQIGTVRDGDVFQAKGQSFSVEKLIGDPQLAEPFKNGEFATVYLSPKDYHRVHMPYAGTLTETLYIPGELFSVNQTTAENIPGLFARNERMVCLFDTEIGRMAVVLVGAMIVAGIETVATGKVKPTGRLELNHHDLPLEKGAELGRFYLGSTAIVLFEKDKMAWDEMFKANSTVIMGECLGKTK